MSSSRRTDRASLTSLSAIWESMPVGDVIATEAATTAPPNNCWAKLYERVRGKNRCAVVDATISEWAAFEHASAALWGVAKFVISEWAHEDSSHRWICKMVSSSDTWPGDGADKDMSRRYSGGSSFMKSVIVRSMDPAESSCNGRSSSIRRLRDLIIWARLSARHDRPKRNEIRARGSGTGDRVISGRWGKSTSTGGDVWRRAGWEA
ncbi:hypothetical protein AG1IA_03064 [Rhizoctonia solani AG-1 IA]|uniref:Uncharacterized protein n=1 Tax=Thanatephorus cucumeris (strain AG1-IA) TaxID=983506 RepID=L8WY27_THACA|nr:hypothetical protein AG1IA_03064 [Rhizoctonia solani AG-1 IA]